MPKGIGYPDPRGLSPQGLPPGAGPLPPPPGGQSLPPGAQQNAEQAIDGQRSMFNPVDAAAMHEGMDPNKISVRDYFGKLGVDVEGPVIQLVKLAQDQMSTKDPIDKMKSIAASQPLPEGAPPAPGLPPGAGPGPPQGLNELLT